jgi:alpha-tubulin suppressor-like RCC1 family protein
MAARRRQWSRSRRVSGGLLSVLFLSLVFLISLPGAAQAGNLPQEAAPTPLPGEAPPLTDVVSLASGAGSYWDVCGVTPEGDVYCWGGSELEPGQAQLVGVQLVVGGEMHFCALTQAGGVKCWGYNGDGQLGMGVANSEIYDAVDVIGLQSGVTALAAGRSHTCAVWAGEVWCWGNNYFGQLGDGTKESRSQPVQVAGLPAGVTGLAGLGDSTCAITSQGEVLCWGLNLYGELGNGSHQSSLQPIPVSGLSSGVVALAGGGYFICALTDQGQVYCWGANDNGQLGDGTDSDRAAPVLVSGLPGAVTAIAAGAVHSCALTASGEVWCWGDNRSGQLGDGTLMDRSAPVRVSGLANASAITAGSAFTCATVENQLYCWGKNSNDQMGQNLELYRILPGGVSGLDANVQAIFTGENSNCAILVDGGAVCWGSNLFDLLGDGSDVDRAIPVSMQVVSAPVLSMDLSDEAGCAVVQNGEVRCWGLGISSGGDALAGWTVSGLSTPVQAVTIGRNFACALSQAGGVQCWGYNGSGTLGDGTTERRDGPVAVIGLERGVTALAAGDDSTCAVTTSGQVWCWGSNDWGQIGDGTKEDRLIPVQVTGLDGAAVNVSVGTYRACALMADGRIACWGHNPDGLYLGNGIPSQSTSPVYVAGTDTYIDVSVGSFHTCGVTVSGTVQCWGGANQSGQLGDNTTENHALPALVQGLAGPAVAVTAGDAHSCALLQNGSVQCWGSNQFSQLGDGTTPDRLTPVLVPKNIARPVGVYFESRGGYRATGPLVPELTTYIPTPLDISLDPGVVGTNLLLAAAAMVLLTVTTELANRTLEANESALRGWLRPANWVARLLQRIETAAQTRLKRPILVEAIKLGGIILIYGLTFSFLEPGWNLFTLTGFYLFFSLTLGGGIVGLADDLAQWLAARRWGAKANLHLHPANLLLAVTSTGASRLLSIIPGFMLGSPQAVEIDPSSLDKRRQRALLWIGGLTLVGIGLTLWLLTILTTLLQRGNLSSLAGILIGGLESLFLSIFALAVQNAFLQMLAFPDSYGRALLRWNRWVWGAGLLGITFVFYHTLVNPQGNLASAWSTLSVRLFLITSGVLALLALGLWLFFKWQARRSARQAVPSVGIPSPLPAQEITLTPHASAPAPATLPLPPAPSPLPPQEIALTPPAPAPARAALPLPPVPSPLPPREIALAPPAPAPLPLPPIFSPPPADALPIQVHALILGLKWPAPTQRLAALQQMIDLGAPAVDALLAALKQPDPWQRMMAAAALGKLGELRAVPALFETLNDPDPAVRQISQLALEALTSPAQPTGAVPPPPPPPVPPFIEPPPKQYPVPSAAPELAQAKAPARRQLWLLWVIVLCIGSLAVLLVGGWLLGDRLIMLSGWFATATPVPTIQPSATMTPLPPSATPTPTLTPTVTPTITPAWPGAFSAPILAAVTNQPPSFTADFATGAGRVALWRCSAPECVVEDGVMRVSLDHSSITLGGYLQARDFVLQFDLLPVESSPNAAAGVFFHHEQGIIDQVNLNIFPTWQQWNFEYDGPQTVQAFGSGQSPQIDSAHWLTVLVVARGEEVALYLNNQPVAYGRDIWTVGDYIFLYAHTPSGIISVDFDNVLFWDLADIGGLP